MDYLVPIHRIINNKLIPNNEFLMLVHHFTGIFTVRINPHNIHFRSIHGHGNYYTNLNNYWCLYLALICVVYKISHQYALDKDTNNELHLTHIFPWRDTVYDVGMYYKTGIHAERDSVINWIDGSWGSNMWP